MACVLFCALLCAPAAWAAGGQALKGIALVIGQADYAHLEPLANPENDARKIEKLLADLGFETDIRSDRDARRLRRDLEGFVEDAEGADVAFIYYSGHGIEAGGENYLVPVDADASSLDAARRSLIPLNDIVKRLQASAKITIVLIDACRTNPFPAGALLRTEATPQGVPITNNGLGAPKGAFRSKQTDSDGSLGVVIGFAAEPGRAALDGAPDTASPYAAAVLKHLPARGVTFGDVMTMVTEEVYLKTRTRQRPWTNASLRRLLYFGTDPEPEEGAEARIRGARRKLLLTISTTPHNTRTFVENLAAGDDLPLDALYGMLKELQVDTATGSQTLEEQLRLGAKNLKAFLAERAAPVRKDPELIRLAGLADRAQDEGAIGLAAEFRALASARADELADRLDRREEDLKADRLELAATYADHARTAALAFDYLTAAARYGAAFEQVKRWDEDLAFDYKLAQADSYSEHGFYKGDNDALRQAIGTYLTAESLAPRAAKPDKWALAQNNLGYAYWRLGWRESGTENLHRAVAAYQAALEVRTRDKQPFYWATLQNNLGNALQNLADRESGTETLQRAIAAYESALEVRTRKDAPYDWAMTQNDLGNALWVLGQRENGTATLKRAAAAFQAALEVRSRESNPYTWGETQNNLGNALQVIGEREQDPEPLRRAAIAYEAALEEVTREKVPLQWATLQNNLGVALADLGAYDLDAASLERAISTLELALEERTRERVPLDWAVSQSNLGNAHHYLATLLDDPDHLAKAVLAYEEALKEFTRETATLQWAAAQNNLGHVLNALGMRNGDTAMLQRAAAAFEAALGVYTVDHVRADWTMLQLSYATTLATLGQSQGDSAILERSVSAFEALLKEQSRESEALDWAITHNNIGYLLSIIGENESDPARLMQAIEHFDAALEVHTAEQAPEERVRTLYNLSGALLLAGRHRQDVALLKRGRQITEDVRAYYRSQNDMQYDQHLVERIGSFDRALQQLR